MQYVTMNINKYSLHAYIYTAEDTQHMTSLDISIAMEGRGGKGWQSPTTGPELDPEIRANPMRSVNTQCGWGVGEEYSKDQKSLRWLFLENSIMGNVMT